MVTMPTDDRPAHEVFDAELEAPETHRVRTQILGWPIRIVGALFGYVDEPSFGDIVVRRIDGGAEVVRVPVTGSEETAMGLDEVRSQLADLTAGEFAERWSITG